MKMKLIKETVLEPQMNDVGKEIEHGFVLKS